MEVIQTIEAMRAFTAQARRNGKRIGLVPTMGALHEGHLTLMRRARTTCDVVVASIFVNPTQFGPNEDFTLYPRPLENDCRQAESADVAAIFNPTPSEMYPAGYATYVNVGGITAKLCGLSRPGHFQGVATVVTKLLNIVQPDFAFFGQKDAQQCLVIEQMASDLNMAVKIVMIPIVRNADGLALSSRNIYLSPEERTAALVLSRSLRLATQAVQNGERNLNEIRNLVWQEITAEPLAIIDYAEIYRYPDLQAVDTLQDKALLALAVKIGKTRLIDNTILTAR
jgi:pantoate--beta-alanine ligase